MKKLMIATIVLGMAFFAHAGSWVASVKMPDGTIITLELPSPPAPDANGMYKLHFKTGGDLIVHASNVWIQQKTSRAKK